MASRLILIDGTCVLYRSFYAIRGLSTGAGQPTNAVFGFIRALQQWREAWRPTHWAVAFDGGSPEERLALLKDYKAQRKPMPDDLRSQGPLVEEFLDCAGVRWLREVGQEADDLLASWAAQWLDRADEVLIATSDKDMFQLVTERVKILSVSSGGVMGPAEVAAKTGVKPEQVVEWLALVGDSSDNIPGVPGVGAKTAAKLLAEFGSLQRLWASLDGVASEKVRASLRASRELVDRNVRMVQLRRDLSPGMEWDEAAVVPENGNRLLSLYERLEFRSLAEKLRQPDLFG